MIHTIGTKFSVPSCKRYWFRIQSLSEIQIQALSGERGAAAKFLVLTVVYLKAW